MSDDNREAMSDDRKVVTIDVEYSWNTNQLDLSSVIHFLELERFVTAGYCNAIAIWGRVNDQVYLLKRISDFGNLDTNILLKIDNSSFMCSGFERIVKIFSIFPPYQKIKEIEVDSRSSRDRVVGISRVYESHYSTGREYESPEKFVLCMSTGDIQVFSLSKGVILKKINLERVIGKGFTDLIQSLMHPHSFFVNAYINDDLLKKKANGHYIPFVNIETSSIERKFQIPHQIYTMDVFLKNNIEYLICGGVSETLFIFNVDTNECVWKTVLTSNISCLFKIGSSHYIVGEDESICEIVDVSDLTKTEGAVLSIKEISKTGDYVESFTHLSRISSFGSDIKIACANTDMFVRILSIKNLNFVVEKDESQKDLIERMEYLNDTYGCQISFETKKDVRITKIDFRNELILYILTVILLL